MHILGELKQKKREKLICEIANQGKRDKQREKNHRRRSIQSDANQ